MKEIRKTSFFDVPEGKRYRKGIQI